MAVVDCGAPPQHGRVAIVPAKYARHDAQRAVRRRQQLHRQRRVRRVRQVSRPVHGALLRRRNRLRRPIDRSLCINLAARALSLFLQCKCMNDAQCDSDGNECTFEQCNVTAGVCIKARLRDAGFECNDGDICTNRDECDGGGRCKGVAECPKMCSGHGASVRSAAECRALSRARAGECCGGNCTCTGGYTGAACDARTATAVPMTRSPAPQSTKIIDYFRAQVSFLPGKAAAKRRRAAPVTTRRRRAAGQRVRRHCARHHHTHRRDRRLLR